MGSSGQIEIELQTIHNNNVENREKADQDGVTSEIPNHPPASSESKPLLTSAQGAESNGESVAVSVQSENVQEQNAQQPKTNVLDGLKKELNKKVVWEIRLWMAILLILVFTVLLILLILYLTSGQQDDADDQYDVSSYVVPLVFRGNFTLSNQGFVQDSISKQNLSSGLEQKLSDIYKPSPALGRYFSRASINTISNAFVQYELMFMMPEEHSQLKRYTLSKKIVYPVLLQQLYDQENEDPLYIEPSSLSMEDGKVKQ